ncbi:MAG: Lrp/AsnC family transcriptional regulator [Clostridia bacterium]|nr:Lrp/AsnC family transcriptional regulator [Clostridia bacterium]
MKALLKLLNENARYTNAQLAVMLGITEDEVQQQIKDLENSGVIKGYRPVINWDNARPAHLTALIELKVSPKKNFGFDEIAQKVMAFEEVESVYLMSGGYDLAVFVTGQSFQDIAMFVAKRLAPLESVLSTATHFILSRYKQSGVIMHEEPQDDRRSILI